MATIIQFTIDELKDIHDGHPWHGTSLKQILSDVTPSQAIAKPLSNAHSIWELVLHLAAWENVCIQRLAGKPANEPEEGDYPPPPEPTEENWKESVKLLDQTHQALIDEISQLTELRLNDIVPARNHTIEYMLRGLPSHHTYHSGQIGMLKKGNIH